MNVLLVANYIPGPVAAYLLKMLGAKIIKVESPNGGDLFRSMKVGPRDNRKDAYFQAINGGFKSIAIDLKSNEGINIFKKLIKKCDLLIDGNRAGKLAHLLREEIHDINQNIIHIPITAYGLKGPMKDVAGHDNNILGLAGVLSYTSSAKNGLPSIYGTQIADITSGYLAALTGMAAYFGKRVGNTDNQALNTIDVSMLHAAFFLNQIYVPAMDVTKKSPIPDKELLNGGLPNYRSYMAKDKAIFFGPIEPALFGNFCKKIEREDLLKSKDSNFLHQELESIFKSKTVNEWRNFLDGVDCCFTPINSLEEATHEKQIRELGLVNKSEGAENILKVGFPAGFSKESLRPYGEMDNSPQLGEHTREIMNKHLGYTKEQIDELYNSETVI